MSGSITPRIDTNSMIIYLDAANLNSYSTTSNWYNLITLNPFTITGDAIYSSDNFGSLYFDGSNSYAQGTFNISNSTFTILFWVYFTAYPYSASNYCSSLLSYGKGNCFGTTYSYQGYTNTFSTCVNINNSVNSIGTVMESNFPTNTWYHYATVYDGTKTGNSNRLKLFINNIERNLKYDATVPATMYKPNSIVTLSRNISGLGFYPNFYGNIALVQIYNRALTSSEISNNYNSTKFRFGL